MAEDKEQLRRFTVSVENDIYEKFEKFRKQLGGNISRSQAIRKAMQALMTHEEYVEKMEGDVVGCITLIMRHEHFKSFRNLSKQHSHDDDNTDENSIEGLENHHKHFHNKMHFHEHDFNSKPIYASVYQTDVILSNDIQHHFGDVIISTMHVHLEFEKCLEIIAVSGPLTRVKALKDNLQKLKSVLSVGFFIVDKKVK